MHYFNKLKLNDKLYDVCGYFHEATRVLIVKCRETLTLLKSWRYEEKLIQKLELINDTQSIYQCEEKLFISDIEQGQVKLVVL